MALGVDYYSLKKRTAAAAAGAAPATTPAFVELAVPMVGKQCLFEVNSAAWASLRVQLLGYDTADVETLARALWSSE
jgi:hypothetical protein